MSDKKLNQLQELIRKVDKIVNSSRSESLDDFHSDSSWFGDTNLRKKMYETNPECFVSITVPNNNPALLPICNRSAIQDPDVIASSMKIIRKINKMGKCDDHTKDVLIAKLKKLKTRLDKECPKSYKSSSRKAKLTKFMNNMKKEVEKIRNQ